MAVAVEVTFAQVHKDMMAEDLEEEILTLMHIQLKVATAEGVVGEAEAEGDFLAREVTAVRVQVGIQEIMEEGIVDTLLGVAVVDLDMAEEAGGQGDFLEVEQEPMSWDFMEI